MSDPLANDDPKLGMVLNGTYRLESILGTGGMGTVYLGRHIHLGTAFAIKSLVPQFTDSPEAVKRFQREAQIASQLGHPNIVKVSDFNYDGNGVPFMVMDLLRGETLRARLMRAGRLTLTQALPIIRQLCDGLDAAHAHGVVHRDLKPENLFLCEGSDQVKILDFGVSKIKSYSTQLTRPMTMLGTPFYMSPEQAMGNTSEVDLLSDVWAVGALVYEILTGEGAFAAENPVAVFYKIVNEPFPVASEHGADVPRAVDRVLARACAKKPSDRIQSTGELARELEYAGNATDQSRPMTVAQAQAVLAGGKVNPAAALPQQETHLLSPSAAEAARDAFPDLATQMLTSAKLADPGLLEQATKLKIALPDALAPSLADDLANESTMLNAPAPPSLGDEENTSVSVVRPSTPVTSGEETAQVVLPPPRPTPVPTANPGANGAPRVAVPVPPPPRAEQATALSSVAPRAPSHRTVMRAKHRRPTWQWVAIIVGGSVSMGAVVGILLSNRRQVEQLRVGVDEAVAERRWDDADRGLRTLTARIGVAPELTAIASRITAERRASEALRLAREMRKKGDGAGAYAELVLVDDKSVYAPDAMRERSAVIADYEDELEKDLGEHRCREALTAARRLAALDPHRPVPPEVGACRDSGETIALPPQGREPEPVKPPRARVPDRVVNRGHHPVAAPQKPPRSEPPPPLEESSVQARDLMNKMLSSAGPYARRCFNRSAQYKTNMKLRVTAFPGSDHFVATAISTGPVEIRSCLEGLFKSVRPPRVTAAVSAERVYSPDED